MSLMSGMSATIVFLESYIIVLKWFMETRKK